MKDTVINLLLLAVAAWFLYKGYQANKKAEPFSWNVFASPRFDDLIAASSLVLGAGIILLLVVRFFLER
jgi:hypothetical protein